MGGEPPTTLRGTELQGDKRLGNTRSKDICNVEYLYAGTVYYVLSQKEESFATGKLGDTLRRFLKKLFIVELNPQIGLRVFLLSEKGRHRPLCCPRQSSTVEENLLKEGK